MQPLLTTNYSPPARSAQATLSLVFLIGGIIVLVGVSLSFLVITFITSGYGYQSSNRALAVASGGVDDALMRLARSKDFYSLSPYNVQIGGYSASITVTSNSPIAGQTTIVSTANVAVYQRKIQAIVAVDAQTGQVHLLSWNQLAI
ncbi:MAG: hypothetical protein AAB686_03300 [Patescibacteria group bacterium]